jgi:hypothetical protein
LNTLSKTVEISVITGGTTAKIQTRYMWHAVAQLTAALRYKPEGHGLDFRLCHWDFFPT